MALKTTQELKNYFFADEKITQEKLHNFIESVSEVNLGVTNPSVVGFVAPVGIFGTDTNGRKWIKTGVSDTDWKQFVVIDDDSNYIIGENIINDGSYNIIHGEYINNSGSRCIIFGEDINNTMNGSCVYSNGGFNASFEQGSAQIRFNIARREVIHNTSNWINLGLNGEDPLINVSTNSIFIQDNSVWNVNINISGTTSESLLSFGYNIKGLIKNASETISILSQNITTLFSDNNNFEVQLAADNTNQAILIQVKDNSSNEDTVRWVAKIEATEVIFT